MPIAHLFCIILTFLDRSDALTVRSEPLRIAKNTSYHARSTLAGSALAPDATALLERSEGRWPAFPVMMHASEINQVLVRPGASDGVIDVVNFGLVAKNFFGVELKRNRFVIDLVLSSRWKDERVVSLIPRGLEKISMAWSEALKLVWMPGLVIANRDIEMYEIISSSVTIFRSGEVVRVERALARCMHKYLLEEYPFDYQDLHVEVTSSKYMLNEVVLKPNMNATQVEETIWDQYDLEKWYIDTYEDVNGHLKKSRGYLDIRIHRSLGKYFDDHLVPTFIVMTISWAVFYFPFATPFITPRLALSVLALLTFTNLMLKSSRELPGPAPFNWNDLFNQQIQALMFLTIVINIAAEVVHHSLKMEQMAKEMNNEAKVILPVSGLVNIFLLLSAGRYKWMSLEVAMYVTKGFILLIVLSYAGYIIIALRKLFKKMAEDELESVASSRLDPSSSRLTVGP